MVHEGALKVRPLAAGCLPGGDVTEGLDAPHGHARVRQPARVEIWSLFRGYGKIAMWQANIYCKCMPAGAWLLDASSHNVKMIYLNIFMKLMFSVAGSASFGIVFLLSQGLHGTSQRQT